MGRGHRGRRSVHEQGSAQFGGAEGPAKRGEGRGRVQARSWAALMPLTMRPTKLHLLVALLSVRVLLLFSQTFDLGGQTFVLGGQTRGCGMSLPRGRFQGNYGLGNPALDRDPVGPLWHRAEMALPAVIEPCLPSPGEQLPTGSGWVYEIKHDGYRLMARRDSVGIRLTTRRGNDWSDRFPLVIEAVNHLKVRSCLVDGEVVCCDEKGLTSFQLLRLG